MFRKKGPLTLEEKQARDAKIEELLKTGISQGAVAHTLEVAYMTVGTVAKRLKYNTPASPIVAARNAPTRPALQKYPVRTRACLNCRRVVELEKIYFLCAECRKNAD